MQLGNLDVQDQQCILMPDELCPINKPSTWNGSGHQVHGSDVLPLHSEIVLVVWWKVIVMSRIVESEYQMQHWHRYQYVLDTFR